MMNNSFFATKQTYNQGTTETKYITIREIPMTGILANTIFTYNSSIKTATFPNGVIIPNFQINNASYVKPARECKFKVNDVVIYKGKPYFVTKVDPVYCYYDLKDYYCNINCDRISESQLTIAKLYWFINSSGEISMTYKGKNTKADEWRKLTNNMYSNIEDARAYYQSVKHKKQ